MNARAKAALMKCKTPEEYIDKSIKSSIPRGKKASVTREWCRLNGYTIEDIKYARHRHPYWKKKKQQGYKERNIERFNKYDFSNPEYFIVWDDELISEFVQMNKKVKGIYLQKDRELAEHFKTTIPSIQYLRRKYCKALKILEADNLNPTDKRITKLICSDERVRGTK